MHRTCVVVCFLTQLAPLALLAQSETEPNDTFGTADVVAVPSAGGVIVEGSLVPADRDYFSVSLEAGDLLSVVTVPLNGTFDMPDTELVVLDTDGTTELVAADDSGDDLPEGLERGSATRLRASGNGTYFIKVRGCCDDDTHTESGTYVIVFSRIQEGPGTVSDTEPDNDGRAGADDSGATAGAVTVILSELETGGGDVDHYSVFLDAGQTLVAMTTPEANLPEDFDAPDTELAIVDTGGNVLVWNDDGGDDYPDPDGEGALASVVRFTAPTSGTYYVAITGYDDFRNGDVLDGIDPLVPGPHPEEGPYVLTLAILGSTASTIPTLSYMGLGGFALLMLLTGWLAMARLRR